jgi:poly(3-hydroxybutyrate) depolymerase
MNTTVRLRRFPSIVLLLLAPRLVALGGEPKVPEAVSPKAVTPGATARLKTEMDSVYFLRVPKGYDPEKGARLIVFLHGSNMNGLQYLRTFEAKGWCRSDLLVCPNGEKGSDPFGVNNFTFASAKYVAAVVREVTGAFKVHRTYLGGHSQGGFVTFSAIMHYPDLFQGAFPMAGDCWMQNEPNLWEKKPKTVAKQKKIAIAVIHGRRDPVVDFSQGEHAHGVFDAMAYPMLKLFAPENLGHQFALSPVPEALEWLDAMKGNDPKHALKWAEKWASKRAWGDAVPAARNVLSMKGATSAQKSRARGVMKKAEKEAKAMAKKMAKAMQKTPARSWLPKWFLFRRWFGLTKAAQSLVRHYDQQREEQRKLGARLFNEARGLFRSNKEEGNKKLEELLEKAPCSFDAWYALKWLE